MYAFPHLLKAARGLRRRALGTAAHHCGTDRLEPLRPRGKVLQGASGGRSTENLHQSSTACQYRLEYPSRPTGRDLNGATSKSIAESAGSSCRCRHNPGFCSWMGVP